jgi:signal transduction histidine kinase
VATHAQVHEAKVTVETDNAMLRMTVQDPGIGFDPDEQKESNRLGILGMRERAELLNGRFDLESTPGGGTEVRVAIPLSEVEG